MGNSWKNVQNKEWSSFGDENEIPARTGMNELCRPKQRNHACQTGCVVREIETTLWDKVLQNNKKKYNTSHDCGIEKLHTTQREGKKQNLTQTW